MLDRIKPAVTSLAAVNPRIVDKARARAYSKMMTAVRQRPSIHRRIGNYFSEDDIVRLKEKTLRFGLQALSRCAQGVDYHNLETQL